VGALSSEAIGRVRSWKRPYVVIGKEPSETGVPQVDVDYRMVGPLALHKLSELGHRRVVILSREPRFRYQREILGGIRDGIRKFHFDSSPDLIYLSPRNGTATTEVDPARIWRLRPSPTACFFPEILSRQDMFSLRSAFGIPRKASIVISEMEGDPDKTDRFQSNRNAIRARWGGSRKTPAPGRQGKEDRQSGCPVASFVRGRWDHLPCSLNHPRWRRLNIS